MIPCCVNCLPLPKLQVPPVALLPFMVLFVPMVSLLPVTVLVKPSFMLTVVCWALLVSLTPCCKMVPPSYVMLPPRAMCVPLRLPASVWIWLSVPIFLFCLRFLIVCTMKFFAVLLDRPTGKGSY